MDFVIINLDLLMKNYDSLFSLIYKIWSKKKKKKITFFLHDQYVLILRMIYNLCRKILIQTFQLTYWSLFPWLTVKCYAVVSYPCTYYIIECVLFDWAGLWPEPNPLIWISIPIIKQSNLGSRKVTCSDSILY